MLDHKVTTKKGRYESLCSRSQWKSCDLLQEPVLPLKAAGTEKD